MHAMISINGTVCKEMTVAYLLENMKHGPTMLYYIVKNLILIKVKHARVLIVS